ncbi:hypothetical protein WCX49_06695 [Sulfurimonas sp. HSL-1656]|uniref:hypothetical protein n=1 Tax=Thiomicrolovo subterrani TaxID=3131934 RepID=UPI0031F91442
MLGGGGSQGTTTSNQDSTANVTVTPETNVTTNVDLEPLAAVLAASGASTTKALNNEAAAKRDAAALEYQNAALTRATVSGYIEKVFYVAIIVGGIVYLGKKKKGGK